MAGSYDYLNARARGLKGKLLPFETLQELSRSGSLMALVERLAAMPAYAAYVKAGDFPETAAGTERALLRSLSAIFHRLWTRADEEVRGWLELWLAPWDLANIHSLLRLWRSDVPAAPPADLWNATGTLSADALNRLASSGALDGLVQRLGSRGALFGELARALRQGAGAPGRRIEDALVQVWARWAVRAIGAGDGEAETFGTFFGWEIDGRNVRTALRLARDGGGDLGWFLPGGARVSKAAWAQIASQTRIEDAMPLLATTPFGEAASAPRGDGEVALDAIDRRIRAAVLGESAELYRRSDPLGVGVLLHLVQLVANEVDNLRLIAHGLERGLPAGLLEERLMPCSR